MKVYIVYEHRYEINPQDTWMPLNSKVLGVFKSREKALHAFGEKFDARAAVYWGVASHIHIEEYEVTE